MAEADTLYVAGLDFFSGMVRRIPSDAWGNATPCEDWSVTDVVGHMGTAVQFGTGLLTGHPPAWNPNAEPADAIEGDPAEWWLSLVEPARSAVEAADLTQVVDSPAGPRTIADGLRFPTIDLFVHAWDAGRGAGLTVTIPDDAVDFALSVLGALPSAQIRTTRVFGSPLEPRPRASAGERLLAFCGRDPHWGMP